MEYLRSIMSKYGSVPNHVAGLVFFLVWYLTATSTLLLVTDTLSTTLARAGLVYLAVIVFMTIVFMFAQILKRIDIVDASWGLAFVVAATVSFSLNPYSVQLGWNIQTIVCALVAIWGLRLSYHIFKRFLRKSEDVRYIKLRKNWRGNLVINSYFRIFLVQALLAGTISIAIMHINFAEPREPSYFVYAGVIVWLIGFLFEVIGDWQLKSFLSKPENKGKLMTSGLWKYTRHPNYFGESMVWTGIFVIALATTYGWIGIITPVLISYLLLYVSGVPMTEESFAGKPGWKDYKKKTSKFIPYPPRQ